MINTVERKQPYSSTGATYCGANKYYKTHDGSTYHSDKNCYHIQDASVVMYESHMLSTSAELCNDCVTDNNEVLDIVAKAKYRNK